MALQSCLTSFAQRVAAELKAYAPRLLPAGGSAGQVLAKSSSADYASGWIDAPSGGSSTPAFPSQTIIRLTDPFMGADACTLPWRRWTENGGDIPGQYSGGEWGVVSDQEMGFIVLKTGGSANGSANIHLTGNSATSELWMASCSVKMLWRFRLDDMVAGYQAMLGWLWDGPRLMYNAASSPNWILQFSSQNGAGEGTVNNVVSTVAATAGYHWMEMTIPATWASATIKLDGVTLGTVNNPVPSPSDERRRTVAPGASIINTTGTTSRRLKIDDMQLELTRA